MWKLRNRRIFSQVSSNGLVLTEPVPQPLHSFPESLSQVMMEVGVLDPGLCSESALQIRAESGTSFSVT